jgi:predicted esterase YcpF (UPF0227 family)
MVSTFCYIHGFASGVGSRTAEGIKEYNPDLFEVGWDCSKSYADNKALMLEEARGKGLGQDPFGGPMVFIGSSMGGVYASMLAYELDGFALLINPVIYPLVQARMMRGEHVNYKSGERFSVSDEVFDSYGEFDPTLLRARSSSDTRLVLGMKDEVLDWRIAQSFWNGFAEIVLLPEEGHRLVDINPVFEMMGRYDEIRI